MGSSCPSQQEQQETPPGGVLRGVKGKGSLQPPSAIEGGCVPNPAATTAQGYTMAEV